MEQEPGELSILEWGGYEAGGTKAQAYGLVVGTDYTDKFGGNSISYTYINNDDQALQKATASNTFDLMHPCVEVLPDYVSRGLVQPFDTELLASFGELNPFLVEAGQVDGKQYMIPWDWDWGYGSLLYGYLWTGTEWVPDPAARTETVSRPQSSGESNVQRSACPRCGEMIAVKAQVCRFCGHEGGPSIKRFVGADMSGMSSARRAFNVVGFAILIMVLLGAILSR